MNTKQNPFVILKGHSVAVYGWGSHWRSTQALEQLLGAGPSMEAQVLWMKLAPGICERVNPFPLPFPTHRQTHPCLCGFFSLHGCSGLVCCEDFFSYSLFSITHAQNNTDNCSQGLLLSPSWARAQRVQEGLPACPWVGKWGCHKFDCTLFPCQ